MTTLELIEKHNIGHNCLSDAYDLGRKDALKPIAKILNDFCCGEIVNSLDALNTINKCIYEQTKEQNNE